ncbi:MAG: NAD-dependent epimerase/dehydratase family protein [Leptospiraceae bacterium]|nr:NAD-dependent epimerase/dehydratase family protein [Leptospiraceae bacterium]
MMKIDKTKPVLVTGATGYVAGWLVKLLLEKGITVHAAVRDPDNKNKIDHLLQLAKKTKGKLKFFKTDLLEEDSYTKAMKGCELVYHTASPFTSKIKDPEKDLLNPAKLGTRNVLQSANLVKSVKRVVVTSSCAAIYGDNIDLQSTPGNIYTEEIWNTSSSLHHQAYSYSKVMAEKEAWSIQQQQKRWDLVVINPSLVIGPALNLDSITSESFNILKQFGDGSIKPGVPNLGIGVVDVRDLAFAHFQAGFLAKASGRHIVSGYNTSLLEMAKALVPSFGEEYPLPRRELPKWIIWLVGPLLNKNLTREFIQKNVGYPFIADNSKSIEQLKVTYRPLQESMEDTFRQMIDAGVF